MSSSFQHQYSAHCESGVMSSLLTHHGLPLSEPMVFGLSGALTMAYIPLVKINSMPLIAYRMPPRHIIKKTAKRLGLTLNTEKFRNPEKGMERLDQLLQQNHPVGLQSSVYWLPYFPEEMRFHFNAHNLIAYDKQGDNYCISDPILEKPVQAGRSDLQRARFVKGALAPKGFLYYLTDVPKEIDLKQPILSAIRTNTKMHLKTPVPVTGIGGIRYLSKKVRQLGKQHDTKEHFNKLYLGHIVRMQEEIGTGGAGFRFLYASFLQESAAILDNTMIADTAKQLTDTGDEWRRFALFAAKMCKGRTAMDYDKLADQLLLCADKELEVFQQLRQL